jgi:general stress protein 26
MIAPRARRPYMPGYGVVGPTEGSGLLPWSWAEERLVSSRNYWVTTLCLDGRPHSMPVWGVWDAEQGAFWFTSSVQSRKAKNIAADPGCNVAVENAVDPVVIEGTGQIVVDEADIGRLVQSVNAKYSTDYSPDFLDPSLNATVRVQPSSVFGLLQDDFSGSPTRWTFM